MWNSQISPTIIIQLIANQSSLPSSCQTRVHKKSSTQKSRTGNIYANLMECCGEIECIDCAAYVTSVLSLAFLPLFSLLNVSTTIRMCKCSSDLSLHFSIESFFITPTYRLFSFPKVFYDRFFMAFRNATTSASMKSLNVRSPSRLQ